MSSYKDVIEKYGFYIATPIGTSMMPLLRQRIDTVKLIKPDHLSALDVVLYERLDGTYVLHRLIKIEKDGTYTMCGDNQYILEHGIKYDQIIGKMEGFYRGEKYIPVTDKDYLRYVKKRMRSRKYRMLKSKLSRIYHKLIRK